jgi:hypothetical protein
MGAGDPLRNIDRYTKGQPLLDTLTSRYIFKRESNKNANPVSDASQCLDR